MTTTEDLVKVTARHNEIIKRLGNGSLNPTDVLAAYQRIIERQFDSGLIPEMYVSPKVQLANVCNWNHVQGWGFTEEDIQRAEAALESFTWPNDRLTALVLVPYLDTVQRTFEELWAAALPPQPRNLRKAVIKSDAEHLRLLEGIEHVPGLRWEVIHLGANQVDLKWETRMGVSPEEARNTNSAHAGVLAAAGHFPKWVQAMDGVKVPYVFLPGYQMTILGHEAWSQVPFLYWDRSGQIIQLDVDWSNTQHQYWATPVVKRVAN